MRGLLIMGLLAVCSWGVTLRFVPYYGFQVLPVIVIMASVASAWLRSLAPNRRVRYALGAAYLCCALLASLVAMKDASIARRRGTVLARSIAHATSLAMARIEATAGNRKETVLAGLQLQDYLQTSPAIRTINWLYREYPDTSRAFDDVLDREHVGYLLGRAGGLVWNVPADRLHRFTTIGSYPGNFDRLGI